tara:strand:- start:230 stop:739 length:510 start_codon:yes stop_codon:yes gene_type:complete
VGPIILNKVIAFIIFLILPANAYGGFPEGEKGYDLNKIEESFKLPCNEIGNDQCLARAVAMGGCIYIFEINKGKGNEDALRKSDEVLITLLDGNDLDINNMFEKDGSIKNDIRSKVISRINFCREATKEAIPNLVKLPEGMEMTEERLESLTNTYPQYYLYMFEQMRKN